MFRSGDGGCSVGRNFDPVEGSEVNVTLCCEKGPHLTMEFLLDLPDIE